VEQIFITAMYERNKKNVYVFFVGLISFFFDWNSVSIYVFVNYCVCVFCLCHTNFYKVLSPQRCIYKIYSFENVDTMYFETISMYFCSLFVVSELIFATSR